MLDAALDRMTRAFFYAAVALLTIAGCMRVTGWIPLAPKTAHASSTSYTANISEMNSLVATYFPQQANNWCSVATATVVNAYAYWRAGNPGGNQYQNQASIANLMNTDSAISPWGAVSGNNGTFKANISHDRGTDPRAVAWVEYTTTPYGYYYHNYIYSNGVDGATRNIASDYGSNGSNVPISVTINGGAHMVAVAGVIADRDPSLNPYTVNVSYVLVYDPWFGSGYSPINYYNDQATAQWISYSDWAGLYKWWRTPYNTGNGYDPEPNTYPGNYYNVPPLSAHWNNSYVTIEQDNIPPGTYSENIALDQYGSPVAHN